MALRIISDGVTISGLSFAHEFQNFQSPVSRFLFAAGGGLHDPGSGTVRQKTTESSAGRAGAHAHAGTITIAENAEGTGVWFSRRNRSFRYFRLISTGLLRHPVAWLRRSFTLRFVGASGRGAKQYEPRRGDQKSEGREQYLRRLVAFADR